MGFDEGSSGARFDFNHIAGGYGARIGIGSDEDEFNRRIGGTGKFQVRAIGVENGVHGDDGFVNLDARAEGNAFQLGMLG